MDRHNPILTAFSHRESRNIALHFNLKTKQKTIYLYLYLYIISNDNLEVITIQKSTHLQRGVLQSSRNRTTCTWLSSWILENHRGNFSAGIHTRTTTGKVSVLRWRKKHPRVWQRNNYHADTNIGFTKYCICSRRRHQGTKPSLCAHLVNSSMLKVESARNVCRCAYSVPKPQQRLYRHGIMFMPCVFMIILQLGFIRWTIRT